jgi:hypothetical protein
MKVYFAQVVIRSGVLFDKLTVAQILKKFSAYYVTRKFITVFTKILHFSLGIESKINPVHMRPISIRFLSVLSSQLLLIFPNNLFPSGITTKIYICI